MAARAPSYGALTFGRKVGHSRSATGPGREPPRFLRLLRDSRLRPGRQAVVTAVEGGGRNDEPSVIIATAIAIAFVISALAMPTIGAATSELRAPVLSLGFFYNQQGRGQRLRGRPDIPTFPQAGHARKTRTGTTSA